MKKLESLQQETEEVLDHYGVSDTTFKRGIEFNTNKFIKGQMEKAYELGKKKGWDEVAEEIPPKDNL